MYLGFNKCLSIRSAAAERIEMHRTQVLFQYNPNLMQAFIKKK